MPIIEFLKTSDNTYSEVSATNPLPTTATISGGTVTADTELPAAAALADATANPTTTSVGALGMGFNGATWDRLRSVNTGQIVTTLKNSLGVEPNIGQYASIDTNGFTSQLLAVASHLLVFNDAGGGMYERWRNNTEGTLLASAARTVTTSSADQTNYNARGLHVVLDVTVAGTGSITLTIEGKDSLSGKYYTLLAGAAVTTNSTNVYKVYPGLPATANVSANDIVPRTYRVTVTANNANSVTYSVASLHVL